VSFYLRRMRLVNVGDVGARFADETLEFTDAEDRAVDTLGWLANGGGKSSIESLLFAHLLPRASDFMQHKDGRALTDYVLDGDTAHVLCEWAIADPGQILPRLLVTGAVYEWEHRNRPQTPDRDKFGEHWYCFRPHEGALAFSDLTFTSSHGLLTAKEFTDALRAKSIVHPELRLSVIPKLQNQWQQTLNANGIDTELLRYQKDMNHTEGGIERLFNFKTHEAFIDFLLDVVLNPEQPDRVAKNLSKVARTLRLGPKHRLEQDFCAEVSRLLHPVDTAWGRLAEAEIDQRNVRERAADLADRLRARIEYDGKRATVLTEEAKLLEAKRTAKDTANKAAGNRARELIRLAAVFAVQTAEADRRDAETTYQDTELERDAWRLVLPLAREVLATQAITGLTAAIEVEQQDLAPLRAEHDSVARILRSALAAEREEASDQQQAALEAAQGADLEAEECDDQATRFETRILELEGDIAGCRNTIKRFEGDLEAARRNGSITGQERPAEALERLNSAAAVDEKRLQELADVASVRRTAAKTLEQDERGANERASELCRQADTLAQTVDAVEQRAEKLAAAPRAAELLETDNIDLWRDAAPLRQRLKTMIAAARQRAIAFAVEAAEDQRALEALQETAFLPGTLEAERLQQFLSKHGIPAQSSWSWLQRNLNAQERGERVKAVPAWATGIVVADDQARDKTLALLNTSGEGNTGFTAIATIAELQHGTYTTATPLYPAPLHPALHDAAAGQRESSTRTRSNSKRDQAVEDLHRQISTDTALDSAIAEVVSEYDSGWIPTNRTQISEWRESANEHRATAEACREQLDVLTQQGEEDAAEQGRLHRAGIEWARHSSAVQSLVDEAIAAAEAKTQQALWEQEQTDQARDKADAARRAALARTSAENHRRAADAYKRRHDDRAHEILTVALLDPGPEDHAPAPAAADVTVESLRRQVELLRSQYQRETSASQLTVRLQEAQTRQSEARREFAAGSLEARTRASELHHLHQGETIEDLRERIAQAERDHLNAATELGTAGQRLETAQERKRAETPKGRPRYVVLETEPADEADALARASDEQLKAAELAIEANELGKRLEDLKEEQRGLETSVKLFDSYAKGLLEQMGPEASASPTELENRFEGDDQAAEAARATMVGALQQAAGARNAAATAFHEKIKELRELVAEARFSELEPRLRERFSADSDEAIGAAASERAAELELRATHVNVKLEEVVRHQAMIVDLINDMVGQALRDLDRAQNGSVMPAAMGGAWSGEKFLRIRFDRPTDEDRRQRIGELVETLVAAQDNYSGTVLVRRAVHAVARRFNVKVLKPNVAQRVEPWEATALGKLSGGEKLTVNIMLYCTLAKLRAINRGGIASGGILVLDNPIGHASRSDLIALQRQVAGAHQVQLFYVTGIEDPGAISQFPNIIRMRNKPNPVKERQYVTLEGQASTHDIRNVSGVRVARPDRGDADTGGGR
jgi:hypothetical protein